MINSMTNPFLQNKAVLPIGVFSVLMFLVSFGDAIMSYVTPVHIEESLKDPFLVGIILSLSSFFGIFFDIFVGEKLGSRTYRFFLVTTLFFAALFPLSFLLLPKISLSFIFAMVVWSIYYELRNYSKYNFVHNFVEVKSHTKAFSVINTFQWSAYMAGPLVAVYLLDRHVNSPFITVIGIVIAASVFYLLLNKKLTTKTHKGSVSLSKKSLVKELKILKILTKRTWPLLLFNFAVILLDVSFWTTGILYAEKLRAESYLGSFFMTVFGIPALFVGLLAPFALRSLGKKRAAFVFGILAGITLFLVGLSSNILVILGTVLLCSTFSGISIILIDAILEDFVSRLKAEGNDLVSANEISINLAYAIGPVVLGFISKYFNYEATFIFVGSFLVVVAITALLITPRKIKMPQKELSTIMDSI